MSALSLQVDDQDTGVPLVELCGQFLALHQLGDGRFDSCDVVATVITLADNHAKLGAALLARGLDSPLGELDGFLNVQAV